MKSALFCFFFGALLLPFFARAHTQLSDGSMTVVLHVEKHAGDATIEVFFQNDQESFALSSCSCSLTLMQGGQPLEIPIIEKYFHGETHALIPHSTANDLYPIEIKGSAKDPASFTPFRIVFAESEHTAIPEKHMHKENGFHQKLVGFIFGSGLMYFFGAIGYDKHRRPRT